MKTNYTILTVLFLLVSLSVVSSQPTAEWLLPQPEIPLKQGEETLAILKPKLAHRSAVLSMDGFEYKMKLTQSGGQCTITNLENGELVGQAKGLRTKSGAIQFKNGQSLSFLKTGKKDNREFTWTEGSSLRFTEDKIIARLTRRDRDMIMAQALVVFYQTYRVYEKEKSSSIQYYPIILN